jgi:hypothetical protein
MMFYYAHTAVVYVNKFLVAGLLDEGIDAFMEQVRGRFFRGGAIPACRSSCRAFVAAVGRRPRPFCCRQTSPNPRPRPPNPQLFEVGVDEMSWDDLSQAKEDWPSVREAWAYRGKAYKVGGGRGARGWGRPGSSRRRAAGAGGRRSRRVPGRAAALPARRWPPSQPPDSTPRCCGA